MKKLNKYVLIVLTLLILSFVTNYLNKEKNSFVDINENIEYQTYDEKKSINNIDYLDFKNTSISNRKIQEILEYKDYMGAINNVSELEVISRITKEDINILKELFKDEKFYSSYRAHNINKATRKQLKFIGFSNKNINKILKYRANKEIENLIELKDIIGDEKIKGGIIFIGDDI